MTDHRQRKRSRGADKAASQESVPAVRLLLSGILAAAAIAGMLLTLSG